MAAAPQFTIYTDGSCIGNPGPGGYAALIVNGESETEIVGGATITTNNQMEIRAVIHALQELPEGSQAAIYSDSQYVINGMNSWLAGWKAKNWRKADKKPVLNVELWKQLDELASRHQVKSIWVRGHAGHIENERVDALANAQAEKYALLAVESPSSSGEKD